MDVRERRRILRLLCPFLAPRAGEREDHYGTVHTLVPLLRWSSVFDVGVTPDWVNNYGPPLRESEPGEAG